VQVLPLVTGDEEVAVIGEDMGDPGPPQLGRQVGFPHPLGEPEPARLDPEAPLQGVPHGHDLFDPVLPQQHREDRLVVPGQQQLHLTLRREDADVVEKVASIRSCLKPGQERAREMEGEGEALLPAQRGEQRAIHVPKVILEDDIEVAHRLVKVEAEREADGISHRGPSSRRGRCRD
jgi:hypothetical protein